MSTTQAAAPTRAAAAPVHRRRVPWTGFVWLTWRQHRWAHLATGSSVGLGVGLFLWAPAHLPTLTCMDPTRLEAAECWLDYNVVNSWAIIGLWLTLALPGIVAAFWGAPMIAREYEHRTHCLAWSQDVSPGRWLLIRVALLMAVPAALAASLALSAQRTLRALDLPGESWDEFHGPWDKVPYETTPVLAVAYVAAALSVGVLASVMLKRTLPAIAGGLVTFGAIRLAVVALRPRLLPPEHLLVPLVNGEPVSYEYPPGALDLSQAWVDQSGQSVVTCHPYGTLDEFHGCLAEAGATHLRIDYQAVDRIDVFRLLEAGIFVAVAAGALALAWRLVRSRRTVT